MEQLKDKETESLAELVFGEKESDKIFNETFRGNFYNV